MATAPALEVTDLDAGYGDKIILRGVSLTLPAQGALAILGPNGAGKTTLLNAISGLLPAERGSVNLAGRDITRVSAHGRVRAGLCHIPDPRGIFPSLTVAENLVLQAPRGRSKDAVERAVEAFPRLGQRMNQQAGTMSGGEQQMLAVSRAYIQNPTVVLLDEVSMGLAPNLVDEIFEFLARLLEQGVSLIIVEQFIHRALALAGHVIVLGKGAVKLSAASAGLTEDQIFHAYSGKTS